MKWYIVASILMLVGLGIFVTVMCINDWDFNKLSTTEYETNEYEITEDFSNVLIDINTANVVFKKSENDKCKVVCVEDVNYKHEVKVEDGAIYIKAKDENSIKFWGINFQSSSVTVYLPKTEYDKLDIHVSTGDVDVPSDFSFEDIDINASTGDIKICGVKTDSMDLQVSTGRINIDSVECANAINIKTSTGDANLADVSCGSLTSEGTTGKITMSNVIATEKFHIKRSTGNVKFDDCDAAEIMVKTSTGNVKGNFLTDKDFDAKASTGKVDVPKSREGGKCEIRTSTGDIIFN